MSKKSTQTEFKLWEMNKVWDVLTDEQKAYIDENAVVYTFKKNEIIHHEGDTPTHMMMLVRGKVRVYKEGVGNRSQIIRMLKPCDFFGYRAMIADGTYNTSVSAFEESVVYFVKKEAFLNVIQENNRFCYLFMVEMARDLGVADTRSVNLTQKHIRGRLAEALLSLKDNYGLDEDQATLSMYMSREDLANLSNMTTSNAIRTLSQFADEGVISIDGRKIKLLDEEQLVRISRMG
ncbi:MAG: Crp/Fnr family transcriptional regulator [Paludibacteraceae bacterium]|nr:Crp/Fnr family transcriptional regulator [Paludibacteraceae bacterium]MBQ9706241.1 Crp/Fnr family transcriptional regulator [Paludibacteraceae bacterium]